MVQLLDVEPQDLMTFHYSRRRASCTLRLSNYTHLPVAFKVMTTDREKYGVQPKDGIVFARSTCDIKVRMQGSMESISDTECKDKFLIKNVVARVGTTTENAWKLFKEPATRDAGEDIKLRVKYVFPSQTRSSLGRARVDAPVNHLLQRRPIHQEVQPRQGRNEVPYSDLFSKIIKIGLLGLAVWFLLPVIWSLTFLVIMLGIKIVNRLVSDSVEDWILKILGYIAVHFISTLFRRNETTLDA